MLRRNRQLGGHGSVVRGGCGSSGVEWGGRGSSVLHCGI